MKAFMCIYQLWTKPGLQTEYFIFRFENLLNKIDRSSKSSYNLWGPFNLSLETA